MDRRRFLQLLTSGAASAAFSARLARALEIPAHRRTGSIRDVEHIVILTQENRSFDSYFGTLRGVRGFADPHPVTLPTGNSAWYQPNGSGYVLPFHPDLPGLGLQFIADVAHGWTDSHAAWNNGKYDGWIAAKGIRSMIYYTRNDIPFHYALADAFTICDAYYCSVIGSTDPNRYHMWTGWVGNDGTGGGPVVDNAEAGYGWSTYPELLEAAGVTWKIYQDIGEGLDAEHAWGWTSDNAYIGNYGDNSLLYFLQYQNAAPGTPLYERARTGTNILKGGTLFDELRADVLNNTLPQVSWIAAPEAYTEHPNWPPDYGAWYASQILDALTANPDVWSKTAFFLNYDENGGFFDHLVPPTPPASNADGLSNIPTTNEIFPGSAKYASGPYGLGVRVPMIVISPWSKGGWVNSEVFDHTSLIRFIEARFGEDYPNLTSPNITSWRRAIAGDLTSAFDFSIDRRAVVSLPSTDAYKPSDYTTHPSATITVPAQQSLPAQESGLRRARAVPYVLNVSAFVDFSSSAIQLQFHNTGTSAAVFHMRSGIGDVNPRSYTVAASSSLSDTWDLAGFGNGDYDLSVYGPNGFFRRFKGSVARTGNANLEVSTYYDAHGHSISLNMRNQAAQTVRAQIVSTYAGGRTTHVSLPANTNVVRSWSLEESFGWYDLLITVSSDTTFERRLAGHVETGRNSVSDPALGGFPLGNEEVYPPRSEAP